MLGKKGKNFADKQYFTLAQCSNRQNDKVSLKKGEQDSAPDQFCHRGLAQCAAGIPIPIFVPSSTSIKVSSSLSSWSWRTWAPASGHPNKACALSITQASCLCPRYSDSWLMIFFARVSAISTKNFNLIAWNLKKYHQSSSFCSDLTHSPTGKSSKPLNESRRPGKYSRIFANEWTAVAVNDGQIFNISIVYNRIPHEFAEKNWVLCVKRGSDNPEIKFTIRETICSSGCQKKFMHSSPENCASARVALFPWQIVMKTDINWCKWWRRMTWTHTTSLPTN